MTAIATIDGRYIRPIDVRAGVEHLRLSGATERLAIAAEMSDGIVALVAEMLGVANTREAIVAASR